MGWAVKKKSLCQGCSNEEDTLHPPGLGFVAAKTAIVTSGCRR